VHSVRIWTLESDYDSQAVKCLAEKLVAYHQLDNVFVRAVGKRAIPRPRRGNSDPAFALKRSVELYLEEDNCVIFVVDTDGPISESKRRKEPNSLINQVERVVRDKSFTGRVHIAWARQELEAWLLIDCKGIFCYFARTRYKENCRDKINQKTDFMRLISKYQAGKTEDIVEQEMGGRGPKEHLGEFSEKILQALNPKMPRKNLKREKYKERLSPKVAEYIEVNSETLKRNNSLQRLGKLIARCRQAGPPPG